MANLIVNATLFVFSFIVYGISDANALFTARSAPYAEERRRVGRQVSLSKSSYSNALCVKRTFLD